MNRLKGMRPHDIIILLKLTHSVDKRQASLSDGLFMSQGEVSESLYRSFHAGLIDEAKKQVFRKNLIELLVHGIKYVFPAIPGSVQRGIPTGHSAFPLRDEINSNVTYIWPDHQGDVMGESIQPLHKNQHQAAREDSLLYQKLALVDAVRLRNPREFNLAINHLNNLLLNE